MAEATWEGTAERCITAGAYGIVKASTAAQLEASARGMALMPGDGEPHQRTIEDVLAALGTDAGQRLTEAEATARLDRFGLHQIQAGRAVPAWQQFLSQFTDVLVLLLIAAGVISVVLWFFEGGSALPYEAIAIFVIVLLNGIMGYVQQARAEKAVQALRTMSAPRATVIRNGERRRIPSARLVPGDIIPLEEGDAVPADARLIETTALRTTEAALTGESVPVSKHTLPVAAGAVLGDRHNMVFSGTAVAYGRGRAVVTATGMRTEMGRIAGMLEQAPEERTPLQDEL